MEEKKENSKSAVLKWKSWKHKLYLLEQTKRQLQVNIRSTNFSEELPGGSHVSVFQEYQKLLDNLEVYDRYIQMYQTVINHLENCINVILDDEEKKVVMIYANYPRYGDGPIRVDEAAKEGMSQAEFHRIAAEAFKKLDAIYILDKSLIKL